MSATSELREFLAYKGYAERGEMTPIELWEASDYVDCTVEYARKVANGMGIRVRDPERAPGGPRMGAR